MGLLLLGVACSNGAKQRRRVFMRPTFRSVCNRSFTPHAENEQTPLYAIYITCIRIIIRRPSYVLRNIVSCVVWSVFVTSANVPKIATLPKIRVGISSSMNPEEIYILYRERIGDRYCNYSDERLYYLYVRFHILLLPTVADDRRVSNVCVIIDPPSLHHSLKALYIIVRTTGEISKKKKTEA